MRWISTHQHGIADCLVALVLLATPYLTDWGGPLRTLMVGTGLLILLMAVLTKFEVGLVKLISMSFHLTLDLLLGSLLLVIPILSPIFTTTQGCLLSFLGMVVLGNSILTSPRPSVSSLGNI
jgi:hypothetical protein